MHFTVIRMQPLKQQHMTTKQDHNCWPGHPKPGKHIISCKVMGCSTQHLCELQTPHKPGAEVCLLLQSGLDCDPSAGRSQVDSTWHKSTKVPGRD